MDQEDNTYFRKWPTFFWRVVGFLQKAHQISPVDCNYLGISFRLGLDLNFCRHYDEDTFNLCIVTDHQQLPSEFEEFQATTCIVSKSGKEHFSSDTTVTRSAIVSREPIWTVNRIELFRKCHELHDELREVSGEEEILTLKCTFLPKCKDETSSTDTEKPQEESGKGCCGVSRDILNLLEDGSTSDLVLECRKIPFKVHRLIISTRGGEYFERILKSKKADMEPETFKKLLQFVYSGRLIDPNCDAACDLYRFGLEYGKPDLSELCRKYLMESLSTKNAQKILLVAKKEDYKENLTPGSFYDDVKEFIIRNPIILAQDEWFQVESLVARGIFYDFLKRCTIVFRN